MLFRSPHRGCRYGNLRTESAETEVGRQVGQASGLSPIFQRRPSRWLRGRFLPAQVDVANSATVVAGEIGLRQPAAKTPLEMQGQAGRLSYLHERFPSQRRALDRHPGRGVFRHQLVRERLHYLHPMPHHECAAAHAVPQMRRGATSRVSAAKKDTMILPAVHQLI